MVQNYRNLIRVLDNVVKWKLKSLPFSVNVTVYNYLYKLYQASEYALLHILVCP